MNIFCVCKQFIYDRKCAINDCSWWIFSFIYFFFIFNFHLGPVKDRSPRFADAIAYITYQAH